MLVLEHATGDGDSACGDNHPPAARSSLEAPADDSRRCAHSLRSCSSAATRGLRWFLTALTTSERLRLRLLFSRFADGRHHFASATAAACVRSSLRRRHPLRLRDDHHPLRSGHPWPIFRRHPCRRRQTVRKRDSNVNRFGRVGPWCELPPHFHERCCAIHGFAVSLRASCPGALGGWRVGDSMLVRFGSVHWWFKPFPIGPPSGSATLPSFVMQTVSALENQSWCKLFRFGRSLPCRSRCPRAL
ncbi:hypothetical protein LF1_08990 [Rubripirellula obstinata]|uniref:Uncharacterized protein n=1 Tax=Rubripirellula obstinata TaxID=406547 RepID=A0A5B1CFN4_9BACT|nr:hypothetical protein LF1_08990 [Rubripirellula obstinata]